MTKPCVGIFLVSFLGACATTANYEKALSTWVGKSENELIGAWGKPSDVREAGGSKFLTYVKTEQMHTPGTPPIYQPTVVGNTVFVQQVGGGSPGSTYDGRCKTTFELAGGKIVSSRWEGNACTSK